MNGLISFATALAILSGNGCATAGLRTRQKLPLPTVALPRVMFTTPLDPSAVICLDQANADALLDRDILIEGHIKALEALLSDCY